MKGRPLRIATLLLSFMTIATGSLFAEVDLNTLVASSHARLQWSTALGYGAIVRNGAEFVFSPGHSWGLLDYRKRIETGAITRASNGDILFTDRGAKVVEAALKAAAQSAPRPHPQTMASVSSRVHPRIAAIIIDPGHGGIDPGTIEPASELAPGQKPLEEKNVVLKIGLDVYHLLKTRYPDKDIVITRKSDVYVSLERRTQIANRIPLKPNEAKIFVSIHANASFDHQAHGYEVWYLPPTFNRNVVNPKQIGTSSRALLPILNNMREQEYETESIMLGKDILGGIHGSIGNDEVDRGLKSNDWFVVRNSKMPAVLIEVGFVSNRKEANRLRSAGYLKQLATGIVGGISRFVASFNRTSGFLD